MLHLALKDLRLLLRDRRTLLVTFAIPLALITLFAFVFGGVGAGKSRPYTLPVSDLDGTELSRAVVARLDALAALDVKVMPLEEAQAAVRKGLEDCVLVIHPGFADAVNSGAPLPVELQYDAAKDIQVAMLQQSLVPTLMEFPFDSGHARSALAGRIDQMMQRSGERERGEARRQVDALYATLEDGMRSGGTQGFAMGGEVRMTSIVEPKAGNGLGLIQAVAGTAIMMLLFSVVGIGASLLDEKEQGTFKRLLCAPVPPLHILLGKVLSANVVSVAQLLVMFTFASLAFGLKLRPHLPGLLLVVLATAWACSAFGVFLASFSKTRQQVQGLSMLVILVMSGIGGSMVPLFLMPAFMQKLAVLSVNYWGIQSFFDALWRELPLGDPSFLGHLGALVLIGLVLNGAALVLFKRRLADAA